MSYDKDLLSIQTIIRETGCTVSEAKRAYEEFKGNTEKAIESIKHTLEAQGCWVT